MTNLSSTATNSGSSRSSPDYTLHAGESASDYRNRVSQYYTPTRTPPAPRIDTKAFSTGSFDNERNKGTLTPGELGNISGVYSKQLQDEMALINNKFSTLRTGQQEVNRGADARVRVLNANTGLIDSGTGTTAINNSEKKGNEALTALETERTTTLQSAVNKIDDLKLSAIKEATAQKRNDLVTYNALRADNAKKADDALKTYVTGGGSLDALKTAEPDSYDAFVKAFGGEDLLKSKAIAYEPKDAYVSDTPQFNADKTQATFFKKDPKTGKITAVNIPMPASTGKTIKTVTRVPGEGTYVFYTDGTYKVLGHGGNTTPPQPEITTTQKTSGLNWLRRQSGYSKNDEDSFNSDPEFQAYVINQAKIENKKTGVTNPFAQ